MSAVDQPGYEVLRELWHIDEWKDGCVYRTSFLELRWVPWDGKNPPARPDNDHLWASVSPTRDPGGLHIRRSQ